MAAIAVPKPTGPFPHDVYFIGDNSFKSVRQIIQIEEDDPLSGMIIVWCVHLFWEKQRALILLCLGCYEMPALLADFSREARVAECFPVHPYFTTLEAWAENLLIHGKPLIGSALICPADTRTSPHYLLHIPQPRRHRAK